LAAVSASRRSVCGLAGPGQPSMDEDVRRTCSSTLG
jgi:hypothetical protein